MVSRHEGHGTRAQQAHTVERAFVQHELHEAQVVGRSRGEAPPTGLQGRGLAHINHLHLHTAFRVAGKGLGNAAVVFFSHRKTGLLHAQRRQNVILQKGPQRLPRDDLNHPAQYISGAAVFPGAAGLTHQGQGGQFMGHLGVAALARTHAHLGVLTLHWCIAHELVGQAGRVAQQVLQRRVASNRAQLHGAVHPRGHLLFAKFRQVLGHRVIEQQLALFHQHQGRDRHDGLGHGVNAKDGIARHGKARGRV